MLPMWEEVSHPFLSRQSETRKSWVQKKVRFENQPKDVGDMSNEEKEKKAFMEKPCDFCAGRVKMERI